MDKSKPEKQKLPVDRYYLSQMTLCISSIGERRDYDLTKERCTAALIVDGCIPECGIRSYTSVLEIIHPAVPYMAPQHSGVVADRSMSRVHQNLRSMARAMASNQYKEISKKKAIRNKGAYVSRFAQRIYVQALESIVYANDQEITHHENTIAQTRADIEELKNTEIRFLGEYLSL